MTTHLDPVEILLVEDNPDDVDLTMEALRGGRHMARLNVVESGQDALAYLRREGGFGTAPRPDLILLDLSLPGRPGYEVLREVKADTSLRRIPVIVLTSSSSPSDVRRSYDLQANCYISKPLGLEEFERIVRHIEDFWLDLAVLPPRERG